MELVLLYFHLSVMLLYPSFPLVCLWGRGCHQGDSLLLVTMGTSSVKHLNYRVGQLISIKAWLIFHQQRGAGAGTRVHGSWRGGGRQKRRGSAATRELRRADKARCEKQQKGGGSVKDGSRGTQATAFIQTAGRQPFGRIRVLSLHITLASASFRCEVTSDPFMAVEWLIELRLRLL